jgi:hypothetical protein
LLPGFDMRTRIEAATTAVYGMVLVMAVVASISEDKAANAGEISEAVILGSTGLFVAHVYAGLLARRLSPREGGWRVDLRVSLVEAWPLLWGAVVPVVVLLITAVAGLPRATAVALALAAGLVQLFVWGVLAGTAHRQRGLYALLSGLISAAIGFLVVLLKAVVH